MMRWLKHRGGAQHHRALEGASKREPLPAAAVIGADPGTILAAVTPVPDTLSEYQFAGLLRGKQGRAGRLQDRAAEGAGRGRDRARGPCQRSTTTATKAPTATTPATTTRSSSSRCSPISAITMRRDPIYLSTFTGRPPDEPSRAGRGAERGVHPAAPAAVPGDRRFLAAARRLLLPHRRGVDEEGLSRPRQARDDGRVVATCGSSCTPSG